jgi:sodium-coupled neutral amino acid transporter 11
MSAGQVVAWLTRVVPLENYVCREVSPDPIESPPSDCQVIEDYFYKDRPFSQRRHVVVTSAIVFISMASESRPS